MSRKYELKRRAERQEETRRRIVEAAIDLHRTIGPARTTVSDIARVAGVQRHTYYKHFPDETSLGLACSGLYMARNPLPDPSLWRSVADPERRLRTALEEIYAYYAKNEAMVANVTRDAAIDPLTREMFGLRQARAFEEMRRVLAEPFGRRGRGRARLLAAIELALGFPTWQSLVRSSGLSQKDAVEAAVRLVRCQ